MAAENQEIAAGATPMCANGCGYFGSAATKNLCSKCYKEHVMMKTAAADAAPVAKKKANNAAPAPAPAEKESATEKHEGSSAAPVAKKKANNAAPAPAPAEKESATEKHEGSSAAPVAKKKANNAAPAPAPAEKESATEKHEGSSAAVADKKVDAAPAPASAGTKESGSSAEKTTEKHEGPSSSGAAAAAAPVMCVNGCTFFGSAATKNMCSSCYKDFLLKDARATPAVAEKVIAPVAPPEISAAVTSSSAPPAVAAKAAPSRCAGAGCKKKVGLLGFVCRCGGTFCSVHRYTDQHACDFDFKTADRELIAKKNPLVVAPKINKI